MSTDAWVTLAVVIATVAMLATERLPPSLVVMGAVAGLLLLGVIDAPQAFAGFSNEAPVTVAALYVLAGAAEATGALAPVAQLALGRGGRKRVDLVRMAVPTAAVSAFVNNTPLVAVVAPQVAEWARRTGRPASRYLMPVSFAAIMGGLVTLLGTSTNLTVSGLMKQADIAPFSLFEITRVGLPIAVVGIAALVILAPVLLPERKGSREQITAREFTVEMEVGPGSPLAGMSVEGTGLRDLAGVFLVEIDRAGRSIAPVAPSETLAAGDRLTFAGNVTHIMDLQRMRGLRSAESRHFEVTSGDQRFYEAVVAPGSPLVGHTLKQVGFRGHYGGAVLAVHRAGARVPSKLGEVSLHPGDVLLILADPDFRERWSESHDFLVVSPLGGQPPLRTSKAPIVGIVALAMVFVAGTGLLPVLQASLAAALVLIALRVVSPAEARNAVDLDIIVLIAGGFGLGTAISQSGLADHVARTLTSGFDRFGDVGTVAGILVTTLVLTEFITNNAAAALMFPIALSTASQTGINVRALAVAVAIGASADFLTPIGYQTNTMVYGMGGYRFTDFTRLGLPLTLIAVAVSLLAIPLGWPLR